MTDNQFTQTLWVIAFAFGLGAAVAAIVAHFVAGLPGIWIAPGVVVMLVAALGFCMTEE
jgi:hypothetical protein